MTPIGLLKEAHHVLATPGHLGVVLTIPRGMKPKGFPRGEFLSEVVRDGVVMRNYSFQPEKIIAYVYENFGLEIVSEVPK